MRRLLTLKTFTAADLASSDSEKADSVCIMSGGVTKFGDLVLLDKFIEKGVETTDILKEVIRQMMYYKSSKGFIEKNRYESIMKTCRKLVRKGFYGDPFVINRIISRIDLIPHYTDKKSRLVDAIQPMHHSHSIWYPREWQDVRSFFLMYPAVEHDDIGDTIEMLISHSSSPTTDVVNARNPYDGIGDRNSSKGPLTLNGRLANRRVNIWTGVAHDANNQRERKPFSFS